MKTKPDMRDLFQKSKQEWKDEARAAARKLLVHKYFITIEDVLEVCPLPTYLHRNTIGSVLRDDDFKFVSRVPSKRPVSNGRYICLWTLAKRPFVDELPRKRKMFQSRLERVSD